MNLDNWKITGGNETSYLTIKTENEAFSARIYYAEKNYSEKKKTHDIDPNLITVSVTPVLPTIPFKITIDPYDKNLCRIELQELFLYVHEIPDIINNLHKIYTLLSEIETIIHEYFPKSSWKKGS